ncbi:hypothetical protein SPLC1_S410350 [Arthrospira platensis C1]|nr:hypothetical protein SPLC1_S410230 [Arthrospira platensis C1]EKD07358.1 hypothetical protein SPLC1_S410240 [Arthrospira platensis C1]EKD07359.1 hypothetical protein SPLC1_S410250 [Arthrospira platensis C1]EKD07360.1 hypothetical protein SPLC1_S410260 [Arthrospira platensis C1]EKD07361.1 hypothetical protein SPLC1_S410270 [Arthrospira platensis C1]
MLLLGSHTPPNLLNRLGAGNAIALLTFEEFELGRLGETQHH